MEYKIEIPYVEGLNLLFKNPKIVLSLPNKDDYNGFSKIYINSDTQKLEESYYVYDDCGDDDGVKENYHNVNLKNKFLYIDGSCGENILLYIKHRWNTELNWSMILTMLVNPSEDKVQKDILYYLSDTYYFDIKNMTDEDFGIDKLYAEKIQYLLEDLALELH